MAARWDDAWLNAVVAVTALRGRLRMNAMFSATCGVVILRWASWLSDQLGTDRPGVVRVVGVILVGYSIGLLAVAASPWARLRRLAILVVAADAVWVAGSAVALVVGAVDGSTGAVLVASTGAVVCGLAIAQASALARASRLVGYLDRPLDSAPPIEAIRVERRSGISPSRLWNAVADHELFGTLARNLDRVEVVSGDGTDLVRRCVATNGDSWTEQCTIWEPGRQHAVEVDTSAYPYPLSQVGCLCYVDSATSRVGLVFQAQARSGLPGQAMMLALHLGRPLLVRIVRGWIQVASRTEAVHA